MTEIILPHSKENEIIVLGRMLENPNDRKIASEAIEEHDFYVDAHKTIFSFLKTAHRQGKNVDLHLATEALKGNEHLKEVGGAAKYLVTVATFGGLSSYIEDYIDKLKEDSRLRQLILSSQKTLSKALEKRNSFEIIGDGQEEFKRIEKNKGSKDKFPIKFLSEFDQNFLLVKPEDKSMLLEYADEMGRPKGFLPKGVVVMLTGAGGVGKTHLLAQLTIAIATGTPWLSALTTTVHCGEEKKGHVFLGLGENQYDDIHRVLYKASKKLRDHQPDIEKEDPLKEANKRIAAFSFCGQQAAFIEDGKPSSYFRQFKSKLIEKAPKEGWSLIIFDPVSRLMGADAETDNAAATQFIALLEELTIDLPGNPTILFAHHVNKSSINESSPQNQTAARGSSAITDGVRLQIHFYKKKDNDRFVLNVAKSNFTAIPKDIEITKGHDGFLEKASSNTPIPVNG